MRGGLAGLLLASAVFSISTGTMHISVTEILGILGNQVGLGRIFPFRADQETVLLFIRLPRVCLGMVIGAGLALSGALMQGLFRNPLADPGLLGISSGASLFAVLTLLLEVRLFEQLPGLAGAYTLSLMAFAGACLTALLIYQLATLAGKAIMTTLLLTGIAINALSGAITGLLMYLANDEQLRNITFWGFGSLAGANWTAVAATAPFVLLTLIFTPFIAKSLNLLALGESAAGHLGVNLKVLRRQVIVLATLAVGASVAMAGMIGFVGLVVPNLVRRLSGADHRQVLGYAAWGGAIVLTLADAVSRIVIAPAELPIGILTALLGTPVLLWILLRKEET